MHIELELDCGPCRLRPLRRDDAPTLVRYANNARVAVYLRDRFPHPYSTDDAFRFLDYVSQTRDECVAGIEIAGALPSIRPGAQASTAGIAGAIGLQFRTDIERCSAELGYWLGEPFWGRGITTAAIGNFTAWAMPRFELTRVYAEVFTENPASGKVLEKCGFTRVGLLRKAAIKRGTHHDYVLYDLVR